MNHKDQAEILIVDDTPENLELLAGMLRQNGYRVRPALNGRLALQSAVNAPPDLILLDISMPDMDGYEVCSCLKGNDRLRNVPVIFISAFNETLDKLKAFSCGGIDYITKPFQHEEVLARVNIHLQLTHVEGLKREISERKQVEEKLLQSLHEKETLIRELYHRTKNTLQLIISMLMLQGNDYPDSEELREVVKNTEYRIRAISLVHQMLYKSQDLSHISINEYIHNLTDLVFQSYNVRGDRISLHIDVQDRFILLDTAIPLGLILNELVTNSLKYAFPGSRDGIITISLTTADSMNTFSYMDNGTGVPEGFDFRNNDTLGLKLIHNIAELQMNGRITMKNENGVVCLFEFPDNLFKARV